jgi:phosphate transport system substrate-binding protein
MMVLERMQLFAKTILFSLGFSILLGCNNADNFPKGPDTKESGVIHISVDESFKPIIDAQIQVYEGSYPDAKIVAHYKPEAECLRDMGIDSIRMIITTRGLMDKERQFVIDSFNVQPDQMVIANDAIAVIVNPAAADSFFTMQEIKDIITAKGNSKLQPVFDGVRATSTVRFMIDSVLRGASLGPNVTAAQNSLGVIDYVAKNVNAIGFIGVSWIGNKEDSAQMSFLKTVKIANIESVDNPGGYIKPWQANIYYKRYPMVRDLVYVLKEKHKGLGHGFASFMSGERGQLIFKRAYLLPARQAFMIRPTAF